MENKPWKDNNLLKRYLESVISIDDFKVGNTDPFHINKYWLYEHYVAFNEKYFNNLLTDNIIFNIEKTNFQLGYVEFSYSKQYKDYLEVPGKQFIIDIHISSYYNKTEKEYCEILLHEMIHIYLTTIIKHISDEEHDSEFESIKDYINGFGWNIKTIQVDDNKITLESETDELIKKSSLIAITIDGVNYYLILTNLLRASSLIGFSNIKIYKILNSEPVKLIKFTNDLDNYLNEVIEGQAMESLTKMTKNELDALVKNGDLEEIKEVDQLKESTISKNPFKLKTLPNGEEVYYWCSKPE